MIINYMIMFLSLSVSVPLSPLVCFQGLDEEALVDHGKSSFTTHTNYETEDLESKFKVTQAERMFSVPIQLILYFIS